MVNENKNSKPFVRRHIISLAVYGSFFLATILIVAIVLAQAEILPNAKRTKDLYNQLSAMQDALEKSWNTATFAHAGRIDRDMALASIEGFKERLCTSEPEATLAELARTGCDALQKDALFVQTGNLSTRKKANAARQDFVSQTVELFTEVGWPEMASNTLAIKTTMRATTSFWPNKER